ncbi:MAG: hypothetical protein M1573_02440 [Candidatus Parvarchaeota archaeon]|jgi:hypothetical protein|nr:hypothetical protein [Candidatus Parvarchaeota archaeon]MCL5018072.1 hypothetical protein [Candidatus Parvarchaeota archaeon]
MRKKELRAIFEGLFIYLLLIWVYIGIENLLYPAAVANTNLSVYVPIPQNLLAVVSFVLSFVFFVLWKIYSDN